MRKSAYLKNSWVLILCALLGVLCAFTPSKLRAQAPPGPIAPKPSADADPAPPPPQAAPPRQTPESQDKPAPAPRQNIGGSWNFNRDSSDDARSKLDQARSIGGTPQSNGPLGGNGPFGGGPYGGGPYGGGPYGGGPYGRPYPGNGPYGGGPYGGPNGGNLGGYGDSSEANSPALREYIYPAIEVSFVLKDSEADLTDDTARKRVFYTDGRKLQKSKDDNYREIAAHWEANRLVAEEKLPGGERVRRTFELSSDGRRLDEEIYLDAARSRSAVTIHYAYDINASRQ